MDNRDCSRPPAPAQPHGLLNQGSTCYLNSVLQVLFMTRDFREAVERHTCENPKSEWIDEQLKDLFDELQQREAYTYKITNKLGINNVNEQRDAAEYFEKILSLTNPDASQVFHGECTHKTTCSECHTCSDADGHFWHLPLELPDSYSEDYSVVDGVEQYFRTSYFDGEDQMYCDPCDAKCDATTKCVMKHHPEVLTLLLKRFDFNYSYMRYVKNDRAVDIPFILQIPENQTYKLYAIVDHFGDLRSGHYRATVKSPDDERWYYLDDASVTLISCPPFQGNIIGNSSSVYLLFYKKTKTHDAETCTRGIINNGSPPVTRDETAVTDGEEGEKGIEVGDDRTAEDISMGIDRPKKRVEDQDDGARQQSNHLCGYPLAEKPMQDKEDVVKDDQEGGQTEAEEQAAQRELFLTNNQLKDRVKDQDFGEAGKYHIPETSDRHDHLNKDDKTREKRGEGSVLDAHTEKQKQNEGNALKDSEDGGHTGADEQVEQSRIEDQDVGDTGNSGGIHKRLDTNREFKADSSDRSATHDHRKKGDEMSEERVKDQDSNDESSHSPESDLEALKQKEVNILKDDEEADEQVGEDQDFSSAQTDDVKLETSHRLARPEPVCEEDEMREVQRGVLNLKMSRVESSQGDGEETKEKSSLENLVQMVDKEKGEIEVKDDRHRQTGAHRQTLRKRQYFSRYDLCYPSVIEDKRRALEKRELDDEDDQEGMTEGDRQTTASKPLLTKYDLCYQGLQYIAGVGDGERQKRSEEDRLSDRHEQQRQERRDRNRGKEQSRREDEPAQRKETSTTKRGLSASLEDENEREVDDFKLNKPEQQNSVSNTKHESVSAEEKTTQGDSKPKEKSGCKEVTEGGGGSGIYWKIIEEVIMQTPGGNQISKSETIRMERVGETEETQTEQE